MSELQRNRLRDQKGFTLLEFLIAVVILSVAMLGMATLTGAMIRYNKEAFDNTRAVALAQGRMEKLKNIPYEDLTDGTDTSETPYTITWTVDDDAPGYRYENPYRYSDMEWR